LFVCLLQCSFLFNIPPSLAFISVLQFLFFQLFLRLHKDRRPRKGRQRAIGVVSGDYFSELPESTHQGRRGYNGSYAGRGCSERCGGGRAAVGR